MRYSYRSLISLFSVLTGILILCISATLPRQGTPPTSEEEGLFVRRIIELWRGEEHDLAKQQMRQFFQEYPQSRFKDRLMAIAGDNEWHHKHYVEAGRYYDQVTTPELLSDILDRRIDTLYHTNQYERLLAVLAGHLPPNGRVDLSDLEVLRIYYYAEGLVHSPEVPDYEEKALSNYQKLFDTRLAVQAKHGAASILAKTGRYKESVFLLLALANEDSVNHDALLMRAAQLQINYDPNAAVQTLAGLKGHNTEGGAFSQVFLLFQSKQYAELLQKRPQFLDTVDVQQKPLLDYFMGRAAFALENYQEAIDILKPLLDVQGTATTASSNEKLVLVTLILSAQKLNQPEVAQGWLSQLEDNFSSDVLLPRLMLSQATLLRAKGHSLEALSILERAQDKLTFQDDLEKAAFERLGLLNELQRWRACRDVACNFVVDFPDSAMLPVVAKLKIQMTARQLQDNSLTVEERNLVQQRLSHELKQALEEGKYFTEEERPTYLLHLAKSEYAQKNFHAAMVAAKEFLENYPRDKEAYQAHLILAYCYFDTGGALQPFISHAESALALRPELPDQDVIRLNLFGAYLQLARTAGEPVDTQGGNTSRAADHLYAVVNRKMTVVKPDNLRWLARFYYTQVRQNGHEGYIEALPPSQRRTLAMRAAEALEVIADKNNVFDKQSISGREGNLQDLVMLSRLYGWLGRNDNRRSLLEQLINRPWPETREMRAQLAQLRLELAQRYEEAGEAKKALKTYEEIVSSASDNDSHIRDATQLQMARLRFYSLPVNKRRSDNPEVVMVLSTLQGLQARRSLAHEPVHLEAAWERANIAAAVAAGPSEDEALLTQLKLAKRQIVSQDDIVSRDYHAARQTRVDKDQIYQAYLMLFDARIAVLEANQAASRHRVQDQRSKLQVAEALYNTLLQGNFAVSNYLVHQAQLGLEEIALVRNP